MLLATLMVYFDASPNAQARVRLAVDLAGRFQAGLIGIAAPPYLPAVDAGVTDTLAGIERKFRHAAAPIKNVEWRGRAVWAGILVPQEARAADLVILGPAPDSHDLSYSHHPGAIILRAGRPVMFVPEGVDKLAARRIVVAWKDTRESRRAVRDALPFLRDAQEVMIVEVCEQVAEGRTSIDDVAEYLSRHKVTVKAKAYLHPERSVAEEILRFAREQGSDFIVAGGYGRSLLGEWVFGGVTRDLLAKTTICCLFSN